MLKCHEPLVKPMSFVGQSTVARGGRGFSQKEQLKVFYFFFSFCFSLVKKCIDIFNFQIKKYEKSGTLFFISNYFAFG